MMTGCTLNDDHVLMCTTHSGKTADPRWESSSSSMVKPLQFTWRHKDKQEREGGTEQEGGEDTNKQVKREREQQGE